MQLAALPETSAPANAGAVISDRNVGIRREPVEPVEPSRRLPGLDGLRAFAIASVILLHVTVASGSGSHDRLFHLLTRVASVGWTGVDLFFVLSGFLITRILLNSKGKEGFFRIFYARRSLRIFPLYYLYLLLVTVVLPLIHRHGTDYWQGIHAWDRASVYLYFYDLRVAATSKVLPMVGHCWSLAVEEQFYCIWPFIVARFDRRALAWIAVSGMAASFFLRMIDRAAILPPSLTFLWEAVRVDGLFLGALLAIVYQRGWYWRQASRLAPAVLAISGAVTAVLALQQKSFIGDLQALMVTPVTIFFAALIVMVLQEGRLARFLDAAVLRRVGIYSYGIYMFHLLVQKYAGMFVSRVFHLSQGFECCLLMFPLTVLLATGVAALSFHFFEAKLLRFKPSFKAAGAAKPVALVAS